MPDYTKVCWYCGKRDMEVKGTYFQCRSCGATWNDVPSLGPDPLADHGYYVKDTNGTTLVHASRARPLRKSKKRAR